MTEAIIENKSGRGGSATTVPLPDVERVNCLQGGSDGFRSRGCRIPDGAMAFAQFPERRRVGSSQRDVNQLPRGRILTADEAAIRNMAANGSLRLLAAESGVSHETVRAVIKRGALT